MCILDYENKCIGGQLNWSDLMIAEILQLLDFFIDRQVKENSLEVKTGTVEF
ncbi:hypothetical protein KI387_010343, partial [Taxus chinensis]